MLKLSARSEYSMILVRHLLKFNEYKKISEISTETWLKEPILRKIVNKLEKAWIISSNKWRNGWILIIQKEISVYDLLSIMWEDLSVAVCTNKVCSKNKDCAINPIIANLQRWLDAVLKITKL